MQSYESTTRRISEERPRICALIHDTLPFYLEGEVSPESRILIDEHLNKCERCASFLDGAQSIQMHLRRENLLRNNVVAHDWPAQQMISRGRRQVITIALVATICAIVLIVVIGWLSFAKAVPFAPTPTPVGAVQPQALPPPAC